ncbi:hypothetical protein AGLY_012900 [Aphis glycines]|uniref:Uncharacterized protein n=1 Tax=Aphis glycines TaxID=307491 RepID=A0A6G0T998_APHGL|nr:hypothetical protein AGLY_012900 [Aphis glycines]
MLSAINEPFKHQSSGDRTTALFKRIHLIKVQERPQKFSPGGGNSERSDKCINFTMKSNFYETCQNHENLQVEEFNTKFSISFPSMSCSVYSIVDYNLRSYTMDGATEYYINTKTFCRYCDESVDEAFNLRMRNATPRIFIHRLQWIQWINTRGVALRMRRLSASSSGSSQYRQQKNTQRLHPYYMI